MVVSCQNEFFNDGWFSARTAIKVQAIVATSFLAPIEQRRALRKPMVRPGLMHPSLHAQSSPAGRQQVDLEFDGARSGINVNPA